MKTTMEYFKMSIDELLQDRGHGYTREECKLLDEGLKVTFFDDMKEYEQEKEECIKWHKENFDMDLKTTLLTINERVAMVFV